VEVEPVNVRRGLFRLWVVLSVIWAAIVGTFFWDQVASPWLPLKNYGHNTSKFAEFAEFADSSFLKPEFTEKFRVIGFGHFNVDLYVRRTVPEADLEAIADRFFSKFVEPRQAEIEQRRWAALKDAGAIAAIPVAVVFILGAALFWAFAGFRRDRASTGA
jgi:hypothetical protein